MHASIQSIMNTVYLYTLVKLGNMANLARRFNWIIYYVQYVGIPKYIFLLYNITGLTCIVYTLYTNVHVSYMCLFMRCACRKRRTFNFLFIRFFLHHIQVYLHHVMTILYLRTYTCVSYISIIKVYFALNEFVSNFNFKTVSTYIETRYNNIIQSIHII